MLTDYIFMRYIMLRQSIVKANGRFKGLHLIVFAISHYGRHRIFVHPQQGRNILDRFVIFRCTKHLRFDLPAGHNTEHHSRPGPGFLRILVKAKAAPILRIEAGGANCAKHHSDWHRRCFGIPISIKHRKAMTGRTAGNGHFINMVAQLFRGCDHIRHGITNFNRLRINIGSWILLTE